MNDSSRTSQTNAMQAASEEDLARRVQDGCLDSFTELAERVQPRLLFVLRRRMGNFVYVPAQIFAVCFPKDTGKFMQVHLLYHKKIGMDAESAPL